MTRYVDIDKAIPMMIQACVDIVGHGITQVDAGNIATLLEDASVDNVVPSVDEILPASALFTLAQMEERRQMLMLKHDAELTLNLLSELKKEAHNKAVHPCGCKIDPYISLKVLDGIIQKYINEYYEEGKKI